MRTDFPFVTIPHLSDGHCRSRTARPNNLILTMNQIELSAIHGTGHPDSRYTSQPRTNERGLIFSEHETIISDLYSNTTWELDKMLGESDRDIRSPIIDKVLDIIRTSALLTQNCTSIPLSSQQFQR